MDASQFPILTLSHQLYSSSRLLIQQIQLVLNEFNLTYPQFLTLSTLWREDGIKVFQLGERLQLDSGTLTPLLKKLEAQNLLKRKRGEADERTVTIHLTFQGKSLQSKTSEALLKLEEKLGLEIGKEVDKLLPITTALTEKLGTLKR